MTTRVVVDNVGFSQGLDVELIASEVDCNWFRWIYASVVKHFQQYKVDYPLYVEGDERIINDESKFAELRMDGPLILVPQKGRYTLEYDINILVQSAIDSKRLYTPLEILGHFVKSITNTIPVYKYGDGPLDDNTFLGCLRLHHTNRSANRGIEVNMFGIIRPDTRLVQATIEGHYQIELTKPGVF